MRDRLQLENFTGRGPTLIEQDVWATAYPASVAFDLANEAEAEALRSVPEGQAGTGTPWPSTGRSR